jgi:hypothetical protein
VRYLTVEEVLEINAEVMSSHLLAQQDAPGRQRTTQLPTLTFQRVASIGI